MPLPSPTRYGLTLIALGLGLAALIVPALAHHSSFYDAQGHYYGQDFINAWGAPQLAATDIDQLFDLERYNQGLERLYGAPLPRHNWSYPLHLLVLLVPFGWLSLPVAYGVWSVLGLMAYGAVVWRFAPRRRGLAVVMALLAPASLSCLLFGQNGFFTASLFLLAWQRLPTHRVLPGVALGVLTVKPQLGLIWPLLLLVQRRGRVMLVAALTALGLLAFSVLYYGLPAWQAYLQQSAAYQWSLVHAPLANRHYETMMPTFANALQKLGMGVEAAFAGQCLVAVLVAALTLHALRRQLVPTSRTTVLLACAASLMTPYLFNYDLTLVSAALVWHVLAVPPVRMLERWIYGLAYCVPVLVYWFYFTVPLAPFILLALWGLVWRQEDAAPAGLLVFRG